MMEEKVIQGSKCLLRRWRKGDEDSLVASANNPNVVRGLLLLPEPYTMADAVEWIEVISKKEPHIFAICVPSPSSSSSSSGSSSSASEWVAVGGCGVHKLHAAGRQHIVRLGYWLGESHWGKGIMSEVVSLLLKYIQSEEFTQENGGVPVVRIESYVFAWNVGSAKVLEKNGFELEGKMKNYYYKKGQLIDALAYAKVL